MKTAKEVLSKYLTYHKYENLVIEAMEEYQKQGLPTEEEIKKYALENYGRLSHFTTIGIIETALKEMCKLK